MSFSTFGLLPCLIRAVEEIGFTAPTPIQADAIPAVLGGADVLACAQTGSGKTAAFALPILQLLLQGTRARQRQARALILTPTRELAAQVGAVFDDLGRHAPHPLKTAVLFGGVSVNPQMMALRGGADIVVATPGRLLDLIERNALAISSVSTLVLDEADRLLDMGFADEIGRVLALLPAQRQTLLFSATYPPALQKLTKNMLRDPVRIAAVAASADADDTVDAGVSKNVADSAPDIAERAIAVDAARRTQLLRHLIDAHAWEHVLVFVATKYAADTVAAKLQRAGIAAGAFHGDLSQGARTQLLAEFKNTKLRVLVATDVAARGIDIALLPAVVNYDLPRSTVDYTHRIGRTARAGASGTAISFIDTANGANSEAHFRLIEQRRQRRLPRERIAGFEPAQKTGQTMQAAAQESQESGVAPASTGGVKGKRKSQKDKLREAAAREHTPAGN